MFGEFYFGQPYFAEGDAVSSPAPPPPPPPIPPSPSVFAGGGGGGPSIHERVLKDMVKEIERRKRKRRLTFVEALIVCDFDVAAALEFAHSVAP